MATKVYNEGDGLRIDDGNKNVLSKFSIGREGDDFSFSDRYGPIDFSGIVYSDIQDKNGNSVGASADEVQAYIDNQVLLSATSGMASASTAFGDPVTIGRKPIVQIANEYRLDPSVYPRTEVFSATGGTADNDDNLFRCQSGTSLGGYSVIRSLDTLNYKAGEGVTALFTASFTTGVALSLQFGGMFSLTETVAIGYDGADFSVLHSYHGAAEVQLITVTASGTGTTTVTLDNDAVNVTTDVGDSLATTAEKLRAGLKGDATLDAKWRFEQVDDKVYCISKSVGNKTGTFSVTGASTATIAEQTAGAVKTDAHVAQANWNITTSPFDGFDPTKMNIYRICYGYLGVANITFSIFDPNTRRFVDVHTIEWANANTTTHTGNPTFKIGWTAASLGSTGTNLTVKGASGALFLDGEQILSNDNHAFDANKASVTTTSTNLITLKNRIVYGDRFNLGKARPTRLSIDNDHNKGLVVRLVKNADIAGTQNYQYINEHNSIILVDTAGGAVTNGDVIGGFTVPAAGSEIIDLSETINDLLPEETLTVAVHTVFGTATDTTGVINWREDK